MFYPLNYGDEAAPESSIVTVNSPSLHVLIQARVAWLAAGRAVGGRVSAAGRRAMIPACASQSGTQESMPELHTDMPRIDIAALADMPAGGTLVLTVNNRWARRLTQALAERLRSTRQVSELPHIVPLASWYREAAESLAFVPDAHLPAHWLDSFASAMVWMDVIHEAEAERLLMDAAQAASLAREADTLLDEWDIEVLGPEETDEYRRFLAWRAAYLEKLQALDAEDANQAIGRVLAAMRQQAIRWPQVLVLAGFTEQSPRMQRILALAREAGTQCLALTEEQADTGEATRLMAVDHAAEWREAAAWAAQQLVAQPEGRFAIVASGLEADAPLARRVLARALRPLAPELPESAWFNISVARPLPQWPAVRAALAWLKVMAGWDDTSGCDAATLGAALLAGHVDWDGLRWPPAALDAQWRRRGWSTVGAAHWNRVLQDGGEAFAERWQRAREAWRVPQGAAGAAVWAAAMRHTLDALGFPGRQQIDSVSYQVLEAFGEALARFAALEPVAGRLGGRMAVALLERLADSMPFQPQRDFRARLDVLGLLEAEGGRWDGLWVIGLTDEVLPASPKPNPLVPAPALRRAGAPRATAGRERAWAAQLYEALLRGAPAVVFSHAEREGERELRPSPFIAGLPVVPPQAAAANAPPLHLEELDDSQGPPLAEGEQVTGGLDVLDTQARNPLWAFVRHRLGGRELPAYEPVAGMNVRGQFLHHALELLGHMLPDQDQLHAAMEEGRLEALVVEVVRQAAQEHLGAYEPALRELECERGRGLLLDWCHAEAARPPFAVYQREERYRWEHGRLALNARVDRIDQLGDGSMLIIDYKTGMGEAFPEADWSRQRPVNLQLPFYAAILAGQAGTAQSGIAGLMLAQVHARHIRAKGLGAEDLGIKGVTPVTDSKAFEGQDWSSVLRRWEASIGMLADEFSRGYAANFVLQPQDLVYCDALPFLRLQREEE